MNNRAMSIDVSWRTLWFGHRQMFFLLFALIGLLLFTGQPAMAAKFINVKTYGAQGNGTTDDSFAIQQAVNDASADPGSTVFFPRGTYLHNSILSVNANKTTLRGVSKAQTILTGSSIICTGSRLTILSITFNTPNQHNLNNVNKAYIANCSFNSYVEMNSGTDCLIFNCDFDGSGFLNVFNSTRVSITLSRLTNTTAGIYPLFVSRSSDITIRQSRFLSTSGEGVYLNSVNKALVENCDIQNTGTGTYYLLTDNSSNLTIRNNVLGSIGNPQGIYGYLSQFDTNVLFSHNKIRNMTYGAYFYVTTGQAVGNNISDLRFSGLITTYPGGNFHAAANQITRSQSSGIAVDGFPGSNMTFAGNVLKDCGLTGATAAIHIDNTYGNYNVTVQNNLYFGNQQNIQYFIRCFVPSPPAVVKGNITTTLLPTLVGPGP